MLPVNGIILVYRLVEAGSNDRTCQVGKTLSNVSQCSNRPPVDDRYNLYEKGPGKIRGLLEVLLVLFRKCVTKHVVATLRRVATSSGGNDDILLAITRHVANRRSLTADRKACLPGLRTRRAVDRAEVEILRRGKEHQTTLCRQ